jgi:anti-sigma regulatory factor (Ser/Thr protein kinase)
MTTTLQAPSLPATVAAEQSFLQIPSQPEWIAPTVEYLKEKAVLCGACDGVRGRKLTLALHEALTNSVVHGNLELSSDLKERSDSAFAEALAERSADPHYGMRPVEIHVDYDGDCCRWMFTDQGKGFDVQRALARAENPDPEMLFSSGRGILLMRTFLDDVRYEAGGRRVVLTMTRPSGEERRREARVPAQRPVRVAPVRADGTVDWEAAYEGVSQNLSRDGIAILQARLATSDRILIGIDWEGQILYVPAEVRHCQSRNGDVVELGCRFQVSSNVSAKTAPATGHIDRAISGLLEQLNSPSVPHDDRRAHPRAAYTTRLLIQSRADSEPVVGFGRDLSKGGISFLTSTPLPRENVMVSLPQHDRTTLRVVARIIRCNQLMAGIYDVAARFLDVADQ